MLSYLDIEGSRLFIIDLCRFTLSSGIGFLPEPAKSVAMAPVFLVVPSSWIGYQEMLRRLLALVFCQFFDMVTPYMILQVIH